MKFFYTIYIHYSPSKNLTFGRLVNIYQLNENSDIKDGLDKYKWTRYVEKNTLSLFFC